MHKTQPLPAIIPGKRVMHMQVIEPEYLGFILNTPEKVRTVISRRLRQWHWTAQDVADWADIPVSSVLDCINVGYCRPHDFWLILQALRIESPEIPKEAFH